MECVIIAILCELERWTMVGHTKRFNFILCSIFYFFYFHFFHGPHLCKLWTFSQFRSYNEFLFRRFSCSYNIKLENVITTHYHLCCFIVFTFSICSSAMFASTQLVLMYKSENIFSSTTSPCASGTRGNLSIVGTIIILHYVCLKQTFLPSFCIQYFVGEIFIIFLF